MQNSVGNTDPKDCDNVDKKNLVATPIVADEQSEESLLPAETISEIEESDECLSFSSDTNSPPVDSSGTDDTKGAYTKERDSDSTSIMSVCSAAAHKIRETINVVLNSRIDDAVSSDSIAGCSALNESFIEKLADFETTVKNNLSVCNVQNSNNINLSSSSNLEANSNPAPEKNLCEKKTTTDTNVRICDSLCTANSNSQSSETSKNLGNSENPSIVEEKPQRKYQRSSNSKKKGEKTMDQILKSLSSFPTTEEKLQALCRKYSEALDDTKSLEGQQKQNEKQIIQLVKEKERLQAEHNCVVLAKSRLESLCRELQRQNKAVKEESLLRIREEEEKRKEVASKFQTTLNEISALMQENSKKNLQLKEENAELAQKLKTLMEHYELWEKHMEKVIQQKELETQLAKAKLTKCNIQLKQETEKNLKEKQILLENMNDLQKKCTQLTTNELQLRTELGDYTSKYEEFQTVLSKSNQVFATFKTDMESTAKKIKKLEKETNAWKQKWESGNNALLDMIADKQKRDKDFANAQQRILTLEKLCRALQAERNDLQNQINGQSPLTES